MVGALAVVDGFLAAPRTPLATTASHEII